MSKKDLLKSELIADARMLALSKLLKTKPQFEMPQSNILSKIQQFLPQIQEANKKLLNKEFLENKIIQDNNILIKIPVSQLILENEKNRKHLKRTGTKISKKYIDMDLYMGVLDVKEDDKKETTTKTKTEVNMITEIIQEKQQ